MQGELVAENKVISSHEELTCVDGDGLLQQEK